MRSDGGWHSIRRANDGDGRFGAGGRNSPKVRRNEAKGFTSGTLPRLASNPFINSLKPMLNGTVRHSTRLVGLTLIYLTTRALFASSTHSHEKPFRMAETA